MDNPNKPLPPIEEKIPYERLLNMFKNYVADDVAGGAEVWYLRAALREICGCDDEDIELLGFRCIFED